MHTLVKAGVRLVIIFVSLQLLTYFANSLISILSMLQFSADLYSYLGLTVMLAVTIVSALILYFAWRKSDWLVTKLAGDVEEKEIVISTNNADLTNVVLRIVGMVLILIFTPKLIGLVANRVVAVYMPYLGSANPTPWEIQQWVTVIGTILIGIWLTISGTGIFKAFTKIGNYIKNTE